MAGTTYTPEQLLTLRESPLVKKPDGLPSISQWMDVPVDQNNTNTNTNNNGTGTGTGTGRRARGLREGEGGAANEQRPVINPMGQFGRRQSMQPGEETVLGPPKLNFASARKGIGEAKERTSIVSADGDNLGDRFPREKNERWTRDRDADRTRDKGYTNGRRAAREDGEGWTNVKGRKSLGQEDFERFGGRNGDRNRDRQEGDPELDAAPRRNNRDRAEPRWGRREDTKEEGTKVGVQGGWRDRDRERERDRDWTRGGNKVEEDPEWMDTKVEKKDLKPRTQEDFQRWKEQMKAKEAPAEDNSERLETPATHEVSTAISAAAPPMLTQPLHTPSTEPTQGILFGNWGRDKAADMTAADSISAKPKPDKKSRFMNMFAKPEEPAAPSQPPMPPPASPLPLPGSNADKEGFERILKLLGGTTMGEGPAAPPNAPAPINGARHGGGVSLDFHQQSPPPEPQNSRPPRTQEQKSILENILAQRPPPSESRPSQQSRFSSMSPDNSMHDQFRLPRGEPNHLEEQFSPQQLLSRGGMVQDANLAALISGRAREQAQHDQASKQKERDFLLTLMQQPSRATPPQLVNQNMPRQNQENHLAAFFDQPRQQPQAPSKGRSGLPPGFMEDPRMLNEAEMMRREAERREQEHRQHLNMQQQQQEAMRAKNARMPMGFSGHEDGMMGLQRRNTANDSRPMTNMGIPSQPVPDMQYMGGRGQPGMPPTPQERTNIHPPPGFGGPMRQPPGLNGPNPQQQMGPSFSAGNTPLGHPPGFPPPGNIRGMGFPGGPGGNGMQGPPQGYFPPGYGPPMPGMRGEDPRMMFEGGPPNFGGPGPRQPPQGRPGPGGMY